MKERLNSEFWLIVAIALFSIVFLAGSFSLPPVAAEFPRYISIATLLLALWNLYERLRPGAKIKPARGNSSNGKINWVTFTLLALAYVGLIYVIGMAVATFIYLATLPYLLNYRRPVVITLYSLIFTAVLISAMKWGFQVPIPTGIIFQ